MVTPFDQAVERHLGTDGAIIHEWLDKQAIAG
jgi:hypothetical protein